MTLNLEAQSCYHCFPLNIMLSILNGVSLCFPYLMGSHYASTPWWGHTIMLPLLGEVSLYLLTWWGHFMLPLLGGVILCFHYLMGSHYYTSPTWWGLTIILPLLDGVSLLYFLYLVRSQYTSTTWWGLIMLPLIGGVILCFPYLVGSQ